MNKYVKTIVVIVAIYIFIIGYILCSHYGLIHNTKEQRNNFLNQPSPYIYNGVNFFNGESLYDNIMKTESTLNEGEGYRLGFSETSIDNEYESRDFYIRVFKKTVFTIESLVIFYYHDANGELISHEYKLDLTPEGFRVKDGNPSQEEIEYITTAKAPTEFISIDAPTLKDLKKENGGKVDRTYFWPYDSFYYHLSGVKQYNEYLGKRNCKLCKNPITIEETTSNDIDMYSKDKSLKMFFSPIPKLNENSILDQNNNNISTVC